MRLGYVDPITPYACVPSIDEAGLEIIKEILKHPDVKKLFLQQNKSNDADADAGLDGLQSPILKFMPDEVVHALMKKLDAQTGDIIFFGADKAKVVNEALGALRIKVAQDLGQIKEGWAPLWVVDFPLSLIHI